MKKPRFLWGVSTIMVMGLCFLLLRCVRDNKPPEVTITSPTDGEMVSGTVVIKAEVKDKSSIVRVSFFVDQSEIAEDSAAPWECEWNTLDFADTNQHTIMARAIDEFDNEGESDPVTVGVSRPPAVPAAPWGPERGLPNVSILFSATATDPDGDSILFQFDWGDGDTSAWTPYVASGDTVTQQKTFETEGTYRIKVRAKDTYEMVSEWSPEHSIEISVFGQIKWRYKVGSPVFSSPAVGSDGTIYFWTADSYLYAITPEGTLKWRYQTGKSSYITPVIGSDGSIYLRCSDSLYAINPDGTLKWLFENKRDAQFESPPVIGSDGTIYVVLFDNCICALAPDGTWKWGYATCQVYFPPAVGSDGTIYYGTDCGPPPGGGGYLYALNPDSTLKWTCLLESGGNPASPLAIGSDGAIYFGTDAGYFYAVSPEGTVKWYYPTRNILFSTPAVGSDGTIYFGSGNNYLYAFTPGGTLKWGRELRYHHGSYITLGFDGTIYIGSSDIEDGEYTCYLYAIAPDGTLKGRFPTDKAVESCPAIVSDGTIYFGCNDGYLYAISTESYGLASSSWPKFGHDNQNTGRAGL
jgi:outer membrane protein assembly factor BamB